MAAFPQAKAIACVAVSSVCLHCRPSRRLCCHITIDEVGDQELRPSLYSAPALIPRRSNGPKGKVATDRSLSLSAVEASPYPHVFLMQSIATSPNPRLGDGLQVSTGSNVPCPLLAIFDTLSSCNVQRDGSRSF